MNPNYSGFGAESDDAYSLDQDPLFPQKDPIQEAVEKQRKLLEEEAKEAKKKTEEAKDAKKKSEKEAKEAKKKAEKTEKKAKDLEKSAKDVAESAEGAREKAEDAKELAEDLKGELAAHTEVAADSNDPVEMVMTDGSEYTATLEEGEEAIFDLVNTAEAVEKTADLADEVSSRASQIARARAALQDVLPEDVGVETQRDVDSETVFGEDGPQHDVMNRLKQAWRPLEKPADGTELIEAGDEEDARVSPPVTAPPLLVGYSQGEALADVDAAIDSPRSSGYDVALSSLPAAEAAAGGGYAYGGSSAERPAPATIASDEKHPSIPRDTPRRSGLFGGAAAASVGYFAGKTRGVKDALRSTDSTLRAQTAALENQAQSVVEQPAASITTPNQLPIPQPIIERQPVVPNVSATRQEAFPETKTSFGSAVPAWITALEKEVKKGKVVEIKKWQRDVLKSQHPELLRNYEKLDMKLKGEIKKQARSTERPAEMGQVYQNLAIPQGTPGDLPSVQRPMPAFMAPSPSSAPTPAPPQPAQRPTSAYGYAMDSAGRDSSDGTPNLNLVLAGGVVFGVVLILVFGF